MARVGALLRRTIKFQDAVQSGGAESAAQTDDGSCSERVLELAAQYDMPVTEDDFSIRRERPHTSIDGSYARRSSWRRGSPIRGRFSRSHVDTF